MFHMTKTRVTPEPAACDEVRTTFAHEMTSLHLLAFLLAADRAKAEQCFVGGLEDCVRENAGFRNWARGWASHTVIKNATVMICPVPPQSDCSPEITEPQPDVQGIDALIAAVTALEPFDRFAFVLSVLEGYPVSECCMLLNCSPEDLVQARSRALKAVACDGSITAISFGKFCSNTPRLAVSHMR